MSHFTVLVIGPDVEAQLAPFQENNMGDCPEEYLEFHDTETEMREEYDGGKGTRYVIMPDGTRKLPWDECFRVAKGGLGLGFGSSTHEVPEGLEQREVPFNEVYPTFEEFARDWHGATERNPEHNRFGYYENPNAKWDWYQVGGRWTGKFKLKTGSVGALGRPGLMTDPAPAGYADQAVKGSVDFEAMRDEAGAGAAEQYDLFCGLVGQVPGPVAGPFSAKPWKTWKDIVHSNPGKSRDEWAEEYYAQEVPKAFQDAKAAARGTDAPKAMDQVLWSDADDYACSREEFVQAARDRAISTYALVKDGEWFEKGEMGWWGVSSNEVPEGEWLGKFNELLDGLPDDTLLTVVDCHI